MKTLKLFGISALLMGVVLFASGCDKFSCGTPDCGPIVDCAPCAAPAPVVTTCSPCGN